MTRSTSLPAAAPAHLDQCVLEQLGGGPEVGGGADGEEVRVGEPAAAPRRLGQRGARLHPTQHLRERVRRYVQLPVLRRGEGSVRSPAGSGRSYSSQS